MPGIVPICDLFICFNVRTLVLSVHACVIYQSSDNFSGEAVPDSEGNGKNEWLQQLSLVVMGMNLCWWPCAMEDDG